MVCRLKKKSPSWICRLCFQNLTIFYASVKHLKTGCYLKDCVAILNLLCSLFLVVVIFGHSRTSGSWKRQDSWRGRYKGVLWINLSNPSKTFEFFKTFHVLSRTSCLLSECLNSAMIRLSLTLCECFVFLDSELHCERHFQCTVAAYW